MLLNTAIALISAALAGAFIWVFLRGQAAAAAADLDATRKDQIRLSTELLATRSDVSQLSNLNAQLRSDLAATQAEFKTRLAAE